MDDQNKNLILATALSFLVILVWFVLFPPEDPALQQPPADEAAATVPGAGAPAALPGAAPTATPLPEARAEAEAPRITIETPLLEGSLSLRGGRIDDLRLRTYRESLDDDADIVTLLTPEGTESAYYAVFGWAQGGTLTLDDVPTADTIWQVVEAGDLSPGNDVVIGWDSPAGLAFRRTISVDDRFMFKITQSVTNSGTAPVRVAPYGVIARHGEPADLRGFFILHEGAIRQTGEEMNEIDYGNLRDMDSDPRWGAQADVVEVQSNGWLGFTDHFWMTTLIPPADARFDSALQYDAGRDIYRATTLQAARDVAPGATVSVTSQFFAGAKEWETIRNYEAGFDTSGLGTSFAYGVGLAGAEGDGIYRFLDSIDWGWFFFFTKPIFWLLHELNILIGNMGWAIIALTFVIKAILFPLAYKSYSSMAKMKELQPEMEKLKERAGDDRQKLQTEMMALYKKEKVNPAAGCLPILVQIPIFFSLYKVIFVTIELRHEPWFGWIRDLSAPDPSSLFNLWGLLPWAGPEPNSIMALIFIGILPLCLGVSMWLQQKLNPAPTDPTQAMIFAWLPWIFMFMLGSFASGLIVYWIANNVITFAQQYLIMRSQGYTPDVFGNILSTFKRNKKADPPAKK
ncbi:MAG: membrane protein insertase YidC [Pseudomonadota bacterium]